MVIEILEFLDFRNRPYFWITLVSYLYFIRYSHIFNDDMWFNFICNSFDIKLSVYPDFDKDINDNNKTDNKEKEKETMTYKYRKELLDYFKYNRNEKVSVISRDKLLVDYVTIPHENEIYEITEDDFISCLIGDGKTSLYDLYLLSLEYVADEIRSDYSTYLYNHIKYLKDKRTKDLEERKYSEIYFSKKSVRKKCRIRFPKRTK